jgi:hypothetical protein
MKFTAIEYELDWDQSSNKILIVNTMCIDKKYKLAIMLIFIIFLSFCFYYLSKLKDEIRENILKFGFIFIVISIKILIIVNETKNELKTQLSANERTEENNSGNGSVIDGKKCLIIIKEIKPSKLF